MTDNSLRRIEKIIQDRYCDLSPVQLKLYEQFSGSNDRQELSTLVKGDESAVAEGNTASSKASSHVFQALKYLLKLCSHPLLVVGDKLTEMLASRLCGLLPANSDIISELHKLHHSPKLVALHEILEECGIGLDASSSETPVTAGQHRVLIFAQHKALLDIIERDLFHSIVKSLGAVIPKSAMALTRGAASTDTKPATKPKQKNTAPPPSSSQAQPPADDSEVEYYFDQWGRYALERPTHLTPPSSPPRAPARTPRAPVLSPLPSQANQQTPPATATAQHQTEDIPPGPSGAAAEEDFPRPEGEDVTLSRLMSKQRLMEEQSSLYKKMFEVQNKMLNELLEEQKHTNALNFKLIEALFDKPPPPLQA